MVVAHVPLDGAWFTSQVAVTDLNGDGHEDALVTRSSRDDVHSYPVTVLLGDGTGRFSDETSSVFDGHVPLVQFPRQIVLADFNGDKRTDVFIADTGDDFDPWPGYQNTLILSAPGGRLVDATANLPQVNDFSHSAAVADVNADGAIDIYVGNIYGANRVPPRILLNDGTGHFTLGNGLLPAAQTDLDQNKYDGSAFADVNGDGKPDLILAADNISANSAVLLNDGAGHFTLLPGALPPKPFGTDAIGLGPQPLEINGDGHPDLLIGYTKSNPFYAGRWIQVLAGVGDGSFRDETAMRLPQSDNSDPWPTFFYPRDLGHDGRVAFGVETGGSATTPLLYLLDPNGVFVPGPGINLNTQPWAFIDARGRGSNDLIGAAGSGDVTLVPELRPGDARPPVSSPPPPGPPDTRAPIINGLTLTPRVFRAAASGPSASRAHLGTALYYLVSEQATTTFSVDRQLPGVKRGHRCVKRRRGTKNTKRCHRFVPLPGTFTHADGSGPNRLRFSGRIGNRRLTPGAYRLDATPTDKAGNGGATVRTPFQIVAR